MTKKYASKHDIQNGQGEIFYFAWVVYCDEHNHKSTREAINSLSSTNNMLELEKSPRTIVELIEERSPLRTEITVSIVKKDASLAALLLNSAGFNSSIERRLIVRDDYHYNQVKRLVDRYFSEQS